MAQVVGKVAAIQADGKGFYKIKVNGNDKWFGTGSKEVPAFNMGQTVELDFDSKAWTSSDGKTVYFHNIKQGTLKVVSASAPETQAMTQLASNAKAHGQAHGALSKDDFWANKEARDVQKDSDYKITQKQIQLQSARNAAIEMVGILASEKAIPYSEAAGKQKPKDRQAVIETLVDHYTAQFLSETQNFGVPAESEQESEPVGDTSESMDA